MKEDYLKFLEEYCIFWNKTPQELLEIKKTQTEATAEKMLDDFVIMWDEPKTYIPRTDNIPDSVKLMAVRAIRSFYSANYLDLAKKAGSGVQYVREKEAVAPTQEELRELCVGLNLRDIALINFISSTGVREGTLQQLTWGHVLPELKDWDGHTSIHIGISAKLLKGKGRGRYKGLQQHTFLTPHATRTLLDYKKWREMKEETIKSDSILFASVMGDPTPISLRDIRAIFERATERHPFKYSPHDLRRFTQTQLEAARVQPNWIRKILGKTVKGEEAPYSRPKIEQLRTAFESAIPYLTLAPPQVDPFMFEKTQLLASASVTFKDHPDLMEELIRLTEIVKTRRKMEQTKKWYEQRKLSLEQEKEDAKKSSLKVIKEPSKSNWDLTGKISEPSLKQNNNYERKIVEENELIEHLNNDWEIERELANGKYIVRKEKK